MNASHLSLALLLGCLACQETGSVGGDPPSEDLGLPTGQDSGTPPDAAVADLASALPAPAPEITALTPAQARAAGGETILIDGLNFQPGATLTLANVGSTITHGYPGILQADSSTRLSFIAPLNTSLFGLLSVGVQNPDGQWDKKSLFRYINSNFSFNAMTGLPSATMSTSPFNRVIVANIDKDGKEDLLALNYANGQILLYYGSEFALSAQGLASVGRPIDVAIADLDNDGMNDAIAVGESGLQVLFQTAKRSFTAYLNDMSGIHRSPIAVADFNNDNLIDFVSSSVTNILPFRNRGNRVITGMAGPAITEYGAMAAGDFDGDKKADFLHFPNSLKEFRWYRGDGSFAFSAPVSFATDLTRSFLLVQDVDQDGRSDVVLKHSTGIEIVFGDAIAGLGSRKVIAVGSPAAATTAACVADMSGDGKSDLVVARDGQLFILLGDGTGSYTVSPAGLQRLGTSNIVSVAAGDFTANVQPDIAIAGSLGTEPAFELGISKSK